MKNVLYCCLLTAGLMASASALAEDPGEVGMAAAAASPEAEPGIANLLRGTRYEELIRESRRPHRVPDKGFLPKFGNYFDTDNPGWGLDIQRLGNFIFAVWFTYLQDGSPYWYIIVGQLDGMSVTGNIESFKWDPFGTFGNQATAAVRGTMTITWTNTTDATATWTLDGESGSAPVSFAQFAAAPTLANMTGHYFDFVRPGWGFTLLTQGSVTVMTMYWYKDGQPVWAQGVVTDMGFSQVFGLLLFNGPGLCPSCLDKKGDKGFTTTELASVGVDWSAQTFPSPGEPPVAGPVATVFEPAVFSGKGGPLGANPFGDIIIPTTTQAVTSVFQDNYDPEYAWFFNLLPDKGPACLPFQYDPGIVEYPASLTGLTGTAYIGTDSVNGAGRLRVYSDPSCTTRFTFPTFTGPGQTSILAAPTGDEGVVLVWKASVPDAPVQKGDDDDYREYEDENRTPMAGGLFSTSQGLAICMYGMMTAQYFALFQAATVIVLFYSLFPPIIFPPVIAQILSDPCTVATVVLILLAAGT